MENSNASLTNPWEMLSTITTFDRGDNAKTAVRLDKESNQKNGEIAPSTSLLIQSLLQQVCMLIEGDRIRRNKLYFASCDRLHELKLIDGSYNMVEFEPLRRQYQQALYHLFAVARAATGCDGALQVPSSLTTEWSRYHKEFEEISFIAAGGFGNVFKALHRLDGTEYAIKKIIVHSGRVKSIMQHLDEVKTLARLNHSNIVAYKAAWIEPTLPTCFIPRIMCGNHSSSNMSVQTYRRASVEHRKEGKSCRSQILNTQHQQTSNSIWCKRTLIEDDDQDMFVHHSKMSNSHTSAERQVVEENNIWQCVEQINSNSISFRCDDDHQDKKLENNTNSTDGSNSYDESSNRRLLPYVPQMDEKCATIYIQMSLCEKTLQQWLDERMEVTPQTIIIAIVTQILCGLHYIHSRGIVHHDIKPSNIFISSSSQLQIQLGDFGLACPLQRENHHSMLGTHMYAAPEQLQGKCDPKSDIYSLGIVLLELLVHTRTRMEKIELIRGLKRGQIPTALTAAYPKWAHIVSQLVQEDPEKRPTTDQLLQDINEDKDVTIARLRHDLTEKDDIIKQLEKRISALEEQIVKNNIS